MSALVMATATVAATSISLVHNIPSAIATQSAAVGTPVEAAPPAASSNITQIIAQQSNEQRMLSQRMPIFLIIVCAAILVAVMLFEHPRFLARWFASMHRRRTAAAEAAARPAYAFDMAHKKRLEQTNAMPRLVGGGDLNKGWILRSGSRDAHVASVAAIGPAQDPHSLPPGVQTDRSPLAPPPHIAPITSRLPWASVFETEPLARLPFGLHTRADLKTILIMVLYVVACTVACTYKSVLHPPKAKVSGYGSDYARTGSIAMSQVPVAIALGVRGNIIGLLIGKGYDRIRILHKIAGRVIFVASTVHSAFFLWKWNSIGKLAAKSASPIGVTGIVALAGVALLTVTSIPVIRRYMYGTFKVAHYIGILLFLAGLGAHVTEAVPWVIAGAALYVASIITSFMKTRFAHAELVALSGTCTTLVTIPGITTGWRAGQHVRLRVFGLGVKNSLEAHPFTIASAPDCGGMVLMAKAVGSWTNDLYQLAASGSVVSKSGRKLEAGVWKQGARVMIEGPYGGSGNTLPLSFSSVCLIAGGSGITHAIGMAQDLIARSPSGVVAARTVDLIWVVRVQQTARAIMPTLNALVEQARIWERRALFMRRKGNDVAVPTALRIHVFVTRVPDSSPLTLVNEKRMSKWERASKLFPSSAPNSALGHGDDDDDDDVEDIDDGSVDPHSASSSSDGHADSVGHDSDWCVDPVRDLGHAFPPQRTASAAEKTKADWLQRNPSTANVVNLHERMTDWTRPMSALSAYRGRPEFKTVINTIVDETMGRHGRAVLEPTGVFVTACGPEYMVTEAHEAARTITEWKSRAAGGVEFEGEFFGF
ncbi:hypothetical protein CcaverHIS002_0501730 [Cutaneotrichosporon cavernicola]|uniref:ferric-chelate reductase (NADPH) n=1 Tax=Cutaneotrichosporon cavernicola TaxID=279322 RepID=A0AA48L631_9TREE|nr:uncharacterized protein CcaverHIS019_0502330 [Cutaneotrichosporon cavernicola]BEI84772.1 hypothetical protein CcaverHIS002_0501730 [Cutaneotrichosporon cavernicola]BEI92605.1 hypothetical protein CcaverHIS019_0502330 [Cutaneotrichosporon cavernicola]BEJ00380.1 hypothetical protein CcaverHIS631_0502370 [Cutaneotrichosporon cavernicola]BEJ08150.1 hypothetical protein CcaverHIS641_0502350 [Cutaneotrichosporon cavernicola]